MYLRNQQGDSFFPSGALVYKKLNWNVSEEHFIAANGEFVIELAPGLLHLRVERGKEYLPIDAEILVPDSGSVEKTYVLKRWVSMNDLGWYSGDMHAHTRLKDAGALMSAEDLNALLLDYLMAGLLCAHIS